MNSDRMRSLAVFATSNHFGFRMITKRVLDLLISVPSAIVAMPIVLLAGMAIKMTSEGPMIFVQRRWGVGESQFLCFKLRTMYWNPTTGAAGRREGHAARPVHSNTHPCQQRVTAVGRWLRRTGIDELPQLVNVILGHMSIVGPRPVPIDMLKNSPEVRTIRGRMKPGITGLWQIRHRRDTEQILDMLPDDFEYIAKFSIWLDLKTIAETVLRLR